MTYYAAFTLLVVFGAMGACVRSLGSDHEKLNRYMLIGVAAVGLIALAGTRAAGIDRDYWNYDLAYTCFTGGYNDCRMEPAFALFSYVSEWARYGVEGVIFLYAFVTIGIYAALIARSETPYLSLLTFFATTFFVHGMTQIRAGLAIAIGLWALDYLYRKQRLKFALFVAIAATVHVSALALMILALFNPKRHNAWLGLALVVGSIASSFGNTFDPLFGLFFEYLFDTESKYIYYANELAEVNRFGFIKGALIAVYLFAAFNAKRIEPFVPKIYLYLNAMLIGLVCHYVFFWLPGAPYRLLELFDAVLIFLLPATLYVFRGPAMRGLAGAGVLAFCFMHIYFFIEIEKLVADYRSVVF